MDITKDQWLQQFGNTATAAVFNNLGTSVSPIEVIDDILTAYNKAEALFNAGRTAPPYLNSVSNPSTATIIFAADGSPIQPYTYTVSLDRKFTSGKATARTSPTTII
jgi:hypothetical protein